MLDVTRTGGGGAFNDITCCYPTVPTGDEHSLWAVICIHSRGIACVFDYFKKQFAKFTSREHLGFVSSHVSGNELLFVNLCYLIYPSLVWDRRFWPSGKIGVISWGEHAACLWVNGPAIWDELYFWPFLHNTWIYCTAALWAPIWTFTLICLCFMLCSIYCYEVFLLTLHYFLIYVQNCALSTDCCVPKDNHMKMAVTRNYSATTETVTFQL